MNEPLAIEQLLATAVADDPTPVEVALLAHLVLDETRLDGWTRPRLSPPARVLRQIIADQWPSVRCAGLWVIASGPAGVFGVVEDAYAKLLRYDEPLGERALAMAARVDAVTVQELACLGPFALLPRALGAHRKSVRPRPALPALSPALERELRTA